MKKRIIVTHLIYLSLMFYTKTSAQDASDGWQVLKDQTIESCGTKSTVAIFSKQTKKLLLNSPFASEIDIQGEKKITQEFEALITKSKVVACTLIAIEPISVYNPLGNFLKRTVFFECNYNGSTVTIGFRDDSSIWLFNGMFVLGIDYYRKNNIAPFIYDNSEQSTADLLRLSRLVQSLAEEITCSKRVFTSN